MKKSIMLFVLMGSISLNAEPLKLPVAIYAASAASDLYTTHRFITHTDLYEKNFMGAAFGKNANALVSVSATGELLIWSTLHKTLFKNHPMLERSAYYVGSGVRFGCVIWNNKQFNNQKRLGQVK